MQFFCTQYKCVILTCLKISEYRGPLTVLELHKFGMVGKLRLLWIQWAQLYSHAMMLVPRVAISLLWEKIPHCIKWPIVTSKIITVSWNSLNHKLETSGFQTMYGFPRYTDNKGFLSNLKCLPSYLRKMQFLIPKVLIKNYSMLFSMVFFIIFFFFNFSYFLYYVDESSRFTIFLLIIEIFMFILQLSSKWKSSEGRSRAEECVNVPCKCAMYPLLAFFLPLVRKSFL